ncbi:MAG: diguanylate cyclase [Chloracidobacterium sp.]|nr:diguanylate cyclase [Chloracidobacterium sp.]
MKDLAIHQYRPPTLLLFGSLFLFTLALLGLAAVSIVELPIFGIVALATAASVSGFVGRFQIRLPKSAGVLPVQILFAYWGVLWFGFAGGVVLGVLSTILNIWPSRKNKNDLIFETCSMVTSIIVSVSAFSLIFGQAASVGSKPGLTAPFVGLIAIGGLTVAAIYLFMNAVISAAFYELESDGKTQRSLPDRFKEQWQDGLLMVLSSIVVCLSFSHFGIEFGFVVAPIAILANIAYSIHTKRLDQKTKQISDASRIHLATVEALATAIDARDQVGLGHVQRTQIYAIRMGELLGLGESDINALRTGALLHDIGKLAVPDHILNKPEKLTAAELEKTKIHSLVGASILEKIGFDYPVVPTVKYNHEFWDGSGYPEGLKGEEIPLTARILAVADAYDTLRGARPYRPAIPRDLARQIIQDEAGTHFDPAVVRCFIKNLAGLEAEIEANGLAYTAENDHGGHNYVEQIKLANREVFELYELAREFSSALNFQETLGMFSKKIGEFVPFTTCAVFLLDETKKYASAIRVDGENSVDLHGVRIRVGEGATGTALKAKESVRKGDTRFDPSLFDSELSEGYSTMASVPLIANDELIGAVSIYSSEIAEYGEEHLRLLETIARIAAEAIDKSQEHDEAKTNALTDPMTGLPNARSLQMQFEKEVGRASRGGTSFQLLMLDLDGFKAVNDSFGHKVGDDVLREVSRVIREQLRDYDFLARYGGDEFVALIPDTSLEDVADLCSRIEAGVSEFKLTVEGAKYASVGVSIGSASYPASGETFDQVIIAADKAMYRRKTRRRLDPSRFMISGIGLDREISSLIPNAEDKSGLIVELDESHVVTSSAVN